MRYYKLIGGARYDRSLLEAAQVYAEGAVGRISLVEMQDLFKKAANGRGITEIEKRTLLYIVAHFQIDQTARTWLSEQLEGADGNDTLAILQKVLRQEYGLANVRWTITDETVAAYTAGTPGRNWEAALRGALEGLLKGSQGPLSLEACIVRREGQTTEAILRTYLDKGTLHLIPPGSTAATDLPYDLPHVLDTENFWNFVLQVPDFEPLEFFSFTHRTQNLQFNKGQFSKKAALEQVISAAVREIGQFDQMQLDIPLEEVQRQLEILPNQNFGNALFAIVDSGIFNRESSSSFGDALRNEIWVEDEGFDIPKKMRDYANTGTLHLIPLDYRAQTTAGTSTFPIPEQFSFWMDGEWVFGLDMPQKTDIQLILTTTRDGNQGDQAWNDSLYNANLPLEQRIQHIVNAEYAVEGLQLNVDIAEYAAQQAQFGPDGRDLPALLRQVFSTIFSDDLSKNSVFNAVAGRNKATVTPEQFDTKAAYVLAIQALIRPYLVTDAVLNMRANVEGENIAPGGETIEQNWIFQVVMETLADHWFWIIVPRWIEEGQRPYVYLD